MKKGILYGIGAVVAVVIVVLVVSFLFLGDIIVETVERVGSDVTKTDVTLDEADTSNITSGELALRGFVMGNPSGFDTDSSVEFDEVSVKVDPKTIRNDVIVVKLVQISGPRVTYELGQGGSNIDVIKRNAQSYGGGQTEKKTDEGEGTRLVIERLVIERGEVNISANFLKGKKAGTALPRIVLTNIGKEGGQNKGATPAEVATTVLNSIANTASRAASSVNLDQFREGAGGALKSGEDAVKGAGDKVKDLFGN